MPHSKYTQDIVAFVKRELKALASTEDAVAMQAYMKTEMPFYGVRKPQREAAIKALKAKAYAPPSPAAYRKTVAALFALPHREEKYTAVRFARWHQDPHDVANLALYERMVRDGAWWDFVDEIAANLVGDLLFEERARIAPEIERFVEDNDMWIRRTALLAHLRHKGKTDEAQLFDHCRRLLPEKEFFIRKAVGWSLRQYSKTRPESVVRFIRKHRDEMSGLTLREGKKQLVRDGFSIDE